MTENSQPQQAPQAPGQRPKAKSDGQVEVSGSPAYAFWLVTIGIGAVTLIFTYTVSIFNGIFQEAEQILSALASLFAVIGTLIGAYFGVKASSDARQTAESAREESIALTRAVLARSEPEVAVAALQRPPMGSPGPTGEQGR